MGRATTWAPRRAAHVLTVALILTAAFAAGTARGEVSGSALRAQQAGLLDVGDTQACAILTDGSVRCWGANADGQLGYGNTTTVGDNEPPSAAGPVRLGPGRRAVQVALGSAHSCALLDDGTVRCWGRNNVGQLGQGNVATIGDDETPDSVPPVKLGAKAIAISAGGDDTCALLADHTARCWGSDTFGQLGTAGDGLTTIGDNETPDQGLPVGTDLPILAIAVSSSNHVCALLEGGRVGCWGEGSFYELGYGNANTIGDDEDPQDAGYVNLGLGRTATAISTGAYDSCAILDDGSATCWGYGQYGRQGRGSQSSVADPGPAGPLDLGVGAKVRGVAAGGAFTSPAHSCALLGDGSLRCWGRNAGGQLGYGDLTDIGDSVGETAGSGGPVQLGPGRTVVAVATGKESSCALLDDGTLRCWGANPSGVLGTGALGAIGDNELPDTVAPVDLGGAMTGAVGDASLTLGTDAASRTVGQEVRLTATLAEDGLDPVRSAAVRLTLPEGLEVVSASPSVGTFAGGVWSVPSVSPGASATLGVVARVSAPGTLTTQAELVATAASFQDADSTPGNGVAGEDDQAAVTVTGTPGPTTNAAPAGPPSITALSLSRTTFAVGRSRTAVSARRRPVPRGTTVRFTLSSPATVRFTAARKVPGRRSGRRCVRPSKAKRRARACTRLVSTGHLTRANLPAGARTLAFSGRIGTRKLTAGRYLLILVPTGPTGLVGRERSVAFRVRGG